MDQHQMAEAIRVLEMLDELRVRVTRLIDLGVTEPTTASIPQPEPA